MRLLFVFFVPAAALLACACGRSGLFPVDGETDSNVAEAGPDAAPPASKCAAAGGTCILAPGVDCANLAPNSAQDCTESGPGGLVCCLDSLVGDGGDGDVSCGQRSIEEMQAITSATMRFAGDTQCTANAECTVVQLATDCSPDCAIVLNQEGAAGLTPLVAAINSSVCGPFVSAGCTPPAAQRCATPSPTCTSGRCR